MKPCNDAVISFDRQVDRDIMESAYRLFYCLSPEFIQSFNWSKFVAGLESSDLTIKWLVDVCLL